MLNEFYDAIKPELVTIVVGALTAVLGFVGAKLRKLYQDIVNDEKKEKIVKMVVMAVDQIYSELSCEEKLVKIKEGIETMLKESKINISEFELSMLMASEIQECKLKGEK